MTLFIRLLDSPVDEKASRLRDAVLHDQSDCYMLEPSAFSRIPGSPFAYWAVPSALNSYRDLPAVTSCKMKPLSTNQLSDDARYARLWWEPGDRGSENWVVWAKGRPYSPFHYDTQTVVRWNESRGTYTGFTGTKDRPLEKPASANWFFRPGLTWPRRTDRLSVSILPRGCIFGNKGPTIFEDKDDEIRLLAYCGIFNSKAFKYLLGLQLARAELAQSFEVGLVQVTPVPDLPDDSSKEMADLVRRVWVLKYRLDAIKETSHAFTLPASILIQVREFDQKSIELEITRIQSKIDEMAFVLYNISAEDRVAVEDWSEGSTSDSARTNTGTEEPTSDEEEHSEEVTNNVEAVLAWAIGVALGRFDVRVATGERVQTKEPEPLDPLPAKCPGMVPDADSPQGGGILVDDQGNVGDLTSIVCRVLEQVHIAQENDFTPEAIRDWFAKSFFPLHIKVYSKSRRKAPIYWQLATPSVRYSVWLYIHAFSKDTLLRVQNDLVAPKLAHEQRQLIALRTEAIATRSKAIETQEKFVGELQTLLDEVKRVAPLWDPDLDDGVIVNSAPLWRLFPHNRGWQRDARDAWEALCRGEYDWAHLAMRLWPDRVVPKCATDRSLAIAHGLEDAFWFEDEEGKWKPCEHPRRSIPDLVRERTSTSVKAALKSLLEAPDPIASSRRRKAKAA